MAGTVSGVVEDLLGRPLGGIRVALVIDEQVVQRDTTDLDGSFTLAILSAEDQVQRASSFYLGQNYPNPFNPVTTFHFKLSESGQIRIYNLLGQSVNRSTRLAPGAYHAIWGGVGDNGIPLAAGIYFYQLRTLSHVMTRKMVLLDHGSVQGLVIYREGEAQSLRKTPVAIQMTFSHPLVTDTILTIQQPVDTILVVTLNRGPMVISKSVDTTLAAGDTLRLCLNRWIDNDSATDFYPGHHCLAIVDDTLLQFIAAKPETLITFVEARDRYDAFLKDSLGLVIRVPQTGQPTVYDVVIYGGTSAGVIAAVNVTRMGKSVILIEPGRHLGGLTSGGLGQTDIGNKLAIGGTSREFYQRVYHYYAQDSAWTNEARQDYDPVNDWNDEESWWCFEPHVAEYIFQDLIADTRVPVIFGERLDLNKDVEKKDNRLTAITMESGRVFHGEMFIDATYEGDLMAKAGVSYTVGREANAIYGETLNGVQTQQAKYHQFYFDVDPYIIPGDTASGLLPGVHGDSPGLDGSGDHRVQAYNFRMCLTDVPENMRPYPKPSDYDTLRYELLLRYYAAGFDQIPWLPAMLPNRKTDTNNSQGFSTDNIGMNYDYPEADYVSREEIVHEHLSYQQGLMWTLANHPRVPMEIRMEVSRWGLAKDEFVDNNNWPHQLYIREARRMIGSYVMTEKNCRGEEVAPESVGLGAYGIDSHNTQRYVDEKGYVRNEGDIEIHGFPPYPISYHSIVPKADECVNLLVPICVSASHIAYSSIRMEPVFMILGESAAVAACLALDDGVGVQQLEYARLQKQLLTNGQILE